MKLSKYFIKRPTLFWSLMVAIILGGIYSYSKMPKLEDPEITKKLRKEGIVKLPEDLGINPADATRDLLAAKNMKDLVDWSGGLYNPPAKFRNW